MFLNSPRTDVEARRYLLSGKPENKQIADVPLPLRQSLPRCINRLPAMVLCSGNAVLREVIDDGADDRRGVAGAVA